ncbi:hypothetical protein DEDE109153_01315 [Deinococcus deserti]|nr:hypothetical protein [Deinococcus deserti]
MTAETRNRGRFLDFMRVFTGLTLLGILAFLMWATGEWPALLFIWVLLVILADELGGWFGYLGLLLGGLAFFAPGGAPAQWAVIVPLVAGPLMGLLLIKHSGGPFVLPFAGLLFAGTLLATGRFGPRIDPQLTLPANVEFQRTAILAMMIGLAFSFVRQVVGIILRRRAARTRDQHRARVPVAAGQDRGTAERVPDTVAGRETVNSSANDETSGK